MSIYFFICFFPFLFYFCCTSTHFLYEFFRLLCGIRFNIKRHRSFAKKTWFFRRSWCFAAVALILTSDFLRSFFVQTLDAGLRFEKFADFISAMNAQETDVNPAQSFLITKLTNSNDKNDSKEFQKWIFFEQNYYFYKKIKKIQKNFDFFKKSFYYLF